MADEQVEAARTRTAEARRAEWAAGLSYLLAGFAHTAIFAFCSLSAVQLWVAQSAWRLGKWSSFPFPYSVDIYFRNFDDSLSLVQAPQFVLSVLQTAIAVGVLHTSIFGVVVLVYRLFGWPRYWQEVRSRFLLRSLWAKSARRSWWLWPVMFAVFLILGLISTACYYIFYPIVGNGWPYSIASTVAAFLAFGIVSARTVRNEVLHRVEVDDLRCMRCGYLLKGLTQPRCPECGSETDDRKRYGLLRWRRRPSARKVTWASIALVVLLVLLPLWVPLGMQVLPRPWLRFIPAPIRPDTEAYSHLSNSFPIRVRSYCIIEHDQSIAVLQFTKMSIFRANYQGAFWLNKSELVSGEVPDSITDEHVSHDYIRTQAVSIGPWSLPVSGDGETMLWLTRPDSSYSVSAYMEDDLPEEYRFIVEKWDEWE